MKVIFSISLGVGCVAGCVTGCVAGCDTGCGLANMFLAILLPIPKAKPSLIVPKKEDCGALVVNGGCACSGVDFTGYFSGEEDFLSLRGILIVFYIFIFVQFYMETIFHFRKKMKYNLNINCLYII